MAIFTTVPYGNRSCYRNIPILLPLSTCVDCPSIGIPHQLLAQGPILLRPMYTDQQDMSFHSLSEYSTTTSSSEAGFKVLVASEAGALYEKLP